MDDYRDYEKAASALQEAIKTLARGGDNTLMHAQDTSERINQKLAYIKKFLNIRTYVCA